MSVRERVGIFFVKKLSALEREWPAIVMLAIWTVVIAVCVAHARPWDLDLSDAPLRMESKQ